MEESELEFWEGMFGKSTNAKGNAEGYITYADFTERLNAYVTTRVKEAELETLDMAYDTIISYGYMRGDGLYMNGGFSTQELAFSHMRRIGAVDRNGLFDPQKYMKYLEALTTTTKNESEQ